MKIMEAFEAVYCQLNHTDGVIFSISPATHELAKKEIRELMPPPETINTYKGIPIEINEMMPVGRIYARFEG